MAQEISVRSASAIQASASIRRIIRSYLRNSISWGKWNCTHRDAQNSRAVDRDSVSQLQRESSKRIAAKSGSKAPATMKRNYRVVRSSFKSHSQSKSVDK